MLKIILNKYYLLFLLIILVSCRNRNIYFITKLKNESSQYKNLYEIKLYNNTNTPYFIKFNIDKLNLSCCNMYKSVGIFNRLSENLLYNDEFIIENSEGKYRYFCDYDSLLFRNVQFEFLLHCNPDNKIKLLPKESIIIDNIVIDVRLLKITDSDKKVRLHYVYKYKNNINILSSQWIDIK